MVKSIIVATFGKLSFALWQRFRNMRALVIKSRIKHGPGFELMDPGYIDFHGPFEVGKNVFINCNLTALIYAKISIGDEVMFGPNVTLLTSGHDPDLGGIESRDSRIYGPIEIGDDAWIGANVTILPNVVIGRNSVIGAGSVVTRSIPPDVIAVGVPCRVLRPKKSLDRRA